jgi:hypothetical protein
VYSFQSEGGCCSASPTVTKRHPCLLCVFVHLPTHKPTRKFLKMSIFPTRMNLNQYCGVPAILSQSQYLAFPIHSTHLHIDRILVRVHVLVSPIVVCLSTFKSVEECIFLIVLGGGGGWGWCLIHCICRCGRLVQRHLRNLPATGEEFYWSGAPILDFTYDWVFWVSSC